MENHNWHQRQNAGNVYFSGVGNLAYEGGGGDVEGYNTLNQTTIDFGASVATGAGTLWDTGFRIAGAAKIAGGISGVGSVISLGGYVHAVSTDQATPAHHFRRNHYGRLARSFFVPRSTSSNSSSWSSLWYF